MQFLFNQKLRKLILSGVIGVTFTGNFANAQESFPYQNPELPIEQRVEDLLSRLSTEEKITLMMNDSKPIKRWGIQTYNWWNEALHGCARAGLATVFPQAIGMAASFDPELVQKVYDVASTEQRIKYIEARRKGEGVSRYHGLTVWTPNINIFRDPRWGRGQETYGEDPYLTTMIGRAAVLGLQGDGSSPYDKLHACLKHYAVHSGPEYERHTFDAKDISLRDLAETYLYAFEELVKTTDVKEVMCAYNRYEGEPCCSSDRLLIQILRNEWGFDGLVVSDCNAIRDLYTPEPKGHGTDPNPAIASANAVIGGTDLECGSNYRNLSEALKTGAIDIATIDRSVRRILRARFELGEMDADSLVHWNHIDPNNLASKAHDEIALQIARKSMTLLQNRNHTLPLRSGEGKVYAVIGPNAADSVTLWGNYNGMPPATTTILEGIRAKLAPNDKLIYRQGSEWVARREFESKFGNCRTADNKQGFEVNYWNNVDQTGDPVAKTHLSTPFHFCTAGATVFHPGVALEDFSGIYKTSFHADQNEEIILDLFVCGIGSLTIDGKEIIGFRTGHGPRRYQKGFKVEAGKQYDIELRFAFFINDAQLNFDLGVKRETNIADLIQNTEEADVYIYVGGISPQLEGEEMKVYFEGFKGGDRTDIELPLVQRETLQQLHATGKPVIFVNLSGSAIGLEPETKSCDAILQAWYGGQAGGRAVADVLFGDYNPAGRLPITFYRNANQLPDFGDYNMPGHTYRYLASKDASLFAFGHGLSYTEFKYGKAILSRKGDNQKSVKSMTPTDTLTLTIPVSNIGKRDGEEVIQLYVRRVDDKEGPTHTLRAFQRTAIASGATENVSIDITEKTLRAYNPETGKLETTPGKYILYYGASSDLNSLKKLNLKVK